ncbi:MAG: hypothetical protein JNL82_16870 [Myxococcales bacterium]|nr:hypothetical protein [Myxococcales bacterium]
MRDRVLIHNGPDELELTADELARLFARPQELWGNLEISVLSARGYAAIGWTGFTDDQPAVGQGFLVRHAGESPLGAQDSPEAVDVLDGGSERMTVAARHLLCERDVAWLAWQLGDGVRPPRWPDGRPLVWSDPTIDEAPWRRLGRLEEPYDERLVTLSYTAVPDAAEEVEPEPAWIGQYALELAGRALTDDEAGALPRTALWSVLRHLHGVADARWLALLAAHPMPWLASLSVTCDELDGLAEAVRAQPRLAELLVYARCAALPAIASTSLEELLLEGMDGAVIDEFLGGSRLPALRVLAIFSDALAGPLDLSRLGERVVVHVECHATDELALLRHAAGAPTLALELAAEHTAEALVAALAARAGRATWVSSLWAPAEEAARLAAARGVRLYVR